MGVFKQTMKRAVREEKSKHLALREFLQQYRVNPHCTTGRTPAELMLGHQVRSSLSVLQPRAHKAKLQQKLPAKPKFSIGEYVHYRDFTRNRPKWVAEKVTDHVGMKMLIVQGRDGHCRRNEDLLKLRSESNAVERFSFRTLTNNTVKLSNTNLIYIYMFILLYANRIVMYCVSFYVVGNKLYLILS